MCFSCFYHSKYHKSIMPPPQCDFSTDVCFFFWSFFFSIYLLAAVIFEKNQVHTSDLTHCKQPLQLIKFYLIKNKKGNRGNWLAQFKFPFLSIL